MPVPRKNHVRIPKWLIAIVAVVFVFGLATVIFIFAFSSRYKDKISPGVKIGDLDLSGKEYAPAIGLIKERSQNIASKGLDFRWQDEQFNIPSVAADQANPDLAADVFSFDAEATVNQIKAAMAKLSEAERVFYWLKGLPVSMLYSLDEDKFRSLLADHLKSYEKPAQDAKLVINQDGSMEVLPEKLGEIFFYNGILAEARDKLNNLDNSVITIEMCTDKPEITKAEGETVINLARQVLDASPFYLIYKDKKWELSQEQVKNWLELKKIDKLVTIGLSDTELRKYLENIASEINIEVKEAKFKMENGRVLEFQPSQNGQALQIDDSMKRINDKMAQLDTKEIDLIVQETEPATTMENINNYGIKELIGEGRSNFRGSPKNRRHNIAVGAATLNGILIKPNEEFSLVKALGKIEASTGYLPELVIKGNKTIPEFGGGLCQIGTTTFRVALNSGLPITARTNHSYRVSYYEPPAGMDATIYDPNPDFRFINDTGHYILFQTEISGDELIFRFYGTKDGRKVEISEPRLFNYVKPGPSKLIETLDLKPGEKKCTERAHTGADAEFTYKVTYPTGEVKTQVFTSHYKPWQEVCLIGVEKLSEPAP